MFVIAFFGIRSYKDGRVVQETLTNGDPTGAAIQVMPSEIKGHMQGSADAPYTLLYYVDYDCPYCIEHSFTEVKEIPKERPSIRVIVRHLPLTDLHPTAFKKASLVECLVSKGEDFFKLSERIILKKNVPANDLTTKDLQLKDSSLLPKCLDEAESQAGVLKSQRIALNVGLYSTPSMVLLDQDGKILTRINFLSKIKYNNAFNVLVK